MKACTPSSRLSSSGSCRSVDPALFRRVHQEIGTTFVIVTHDTGVPESADRAIEMRDGMIARDAA